jgi:hypothetical protein
VAKNVFIEATKDRHTIREGMRSLVKATGFEDSTKGHRDFAMVLQAAISLSFVDGDVDILGSITEKFIPPGLKERMKR